MGLCDKMTTPVTSGLLTVRKKRTFDIAFLTGRSEESSGSSTNNNCSSSKRAILSEDESDPANLLLSEQTNSSSNGSIDVLTNGSSLSESESRSPVPPIKSGKGKRGRGFMSRGSPTGPGQGHQEIKKSSEDLRFGSPEVNHAGPQFSPHQILPINPAGGSPELSLPFGFLPHGMPKFGLPGLHFGHPGTKADLMLSYGAAGKVRRGGYGPPEHYQGPGIYPPYHPYPGLNIGLMIPQEVRGHQGQGGQEGGTATLLPPSLTALTLPAQNVCAKCNIGFRMTSDLVYHMRSHHKRETDPMKKKREDKLKCPVCHETFRERHHLTRHMTAHQDRAEEVEDSSKPIQIL